MRTITSFTLAVLLWSSLLIAVPAAADAEPDDSPEVQCEGDTRTEIHESHGRTEYVFTYNRSAQRVCAVAKSTGERKGFFGYSVWIDGSRISSIDTKELEPGDTFRENQTITEGIDATKDNHSILITSYGKSVQFNFTQEIDPMKEGGVPTPHIKNISTKRNGTKSGQPNIIVDVEEGGRNYNPEAVVKTFESNLRWLGGDYSTRLSEANDEVIVGTVKLYGDTYYTGTKWDRVSFVSYPNGTYETWEPEFGEIPTDREIESRQIYYENESAKKYRGPDVDPISEKASKAGAAVVVAIVAGGLWYWRR